MADAAHEVDYDEFGMLADNASEVGLPFDGPPALERMWVDVGGGQELSAIKWGDSPPEVVLLHGGAQNSHTWDTVLLALDRPALAIDLPGHGHSSWRDDKKYWPAENVAPVARVIEELAPEAKLVVGMSLGGLTAFALAAARPDLVPRLLIVDVTPGVNGNKASQIAAFVAGPERFESFDEILQRTITYNPTRTESSLRRGILHNATGDADGSWRWRYDRFRIPADADGDGVPDFSTLWEAVSAATMPVHLVVGTLSEVVDADDVAEVKRRLPDAVVTHVEDAGHSIQGDRPRVLAEILRAELAGVVTGSAALLPVPPTLLAQTRVALQSVAEHVLAPARYAAEGHIGLVPTPDGFGTPPFTAADGTERQLRVEGVNLVSTRDGRVRWGILATLGAAAKLAGVEPGASPTPYTPSTDADPDALLTIDTRSAEFLEAWFGWSGALLDTLRAELPAAADPSAVQLWPEHFDLAFDAGTEDHRGTFGASPGDAPHPEPYLYVTRWAGTTDDPYWNETAFAGASLAYASLFAAADPVATALDFLRRGLSLL